MSGLWLGAIGFLLIVIVAAYVVAKRLDGDL